MRCHGHALLLASGAIFVCLLTNAPAQRQTQSSGQAPSEKALRGSDWLAFFPLQAGNEWTYSDGNSGFTVRVLGAAVQPNGFEYYEVSGYFPEDSTTIRKLRRGPLGQVLEYNPAGADYQWYGFGYPRGPWRFETAGDIPCVTGSQVGIASVDAEVDVPAGKFERTLRLDLQPPCADAGLTTEYFAGGVGLVQRVATTIAGAKTFKLVAALVGSSRYPETYYGIEISLDRPVFYNNLMPPIANPWPTARVVLVVRNKTEYPLEFTFPTSQRFEFIIRDAKSQEVLRWSDGRAFLQVVGRETLQNESRTYSADILLRGRDGKILPAGFYTITGYLMIQGLESGGLASMATATFELRDLH